MNTEIDKGSEVGNVCDCALQLHSLFEVADLLDVLAELRHDELLAWIAARFKQFLANIIDSISAALRFECFEIDRVDLRGVFDKLVDGNPQCRCHAFDERIEL